jgi:DNA repair exonuclease SbcCD ATPase subunit
MVGALARGSGAMHKTGWRCRAVGLLVVVWGSGLVQAQTVPPRAADPALARCIVAAREQLAELNQALTASQARHRANPVMVTRLQTLDAELAQLRVRAGRETRSLADCEQLGQTLAAEHERLARMAGPDPLVADCMEANAQALRDTLLALDGAVKAASTRPTQAAQAQAALKRLDDLRPGIARESQNLAACRQHSSALAQEKQQALALQSAAAGPDPMVEGAALAACRATVVDAYADTRQAWRDAALLAGLQAGNPVLDGAIARLRQWREAVAKPPASLSDCQTLTQALEQERVRASGQAQGSRPASG